MQVLRGQVNARGIVRVQVVCGEAEAHAAQGYAMEEARRAVGGPVEFLYSVPTATMPDAWSRDYIFAARLGIRGHAPAWVGAEAA